jgi:hypothetical protein
MTALTFSPGAAVFMVLLASSLWGTWAIALKHLHTFPLDAFVLTLFLWSFLFVWAVALIGTNAGVLSELPRTAQEHRAVIISTLIGGVIYQWGMRIWLLVIHMRGLIFTTSITASISLIIGTLFSALAGGLPRGASAPLLALGTVVLLLAIMTVTAATALREAALAAAGPRPGSTPGTRLPLWLAILLCVANGLFTAAYPAALALGLQSQLRPNGLTVPAYMAVLASGAAAGAALTSGLWLTRQRRWSCVLHAPRRYIVYGMLAGFAHYGGNIINAFAVPVLSPTIAWPMGTTSSLWGVAWGYVYREYSGVPRRVYWMQAAGIALFIAGVVVLTVAR